MTDDILSQVKQAEIEADKMLDSAKEEAHKLVEEAKIRADNSYREKLDSAKNEAKNIVDEAKAKALEESKPVIDEAAGAELFVALPCSGYVVTENESADALQKAEAKLIALLTAFDYETQK